MFDNLVRVSKAKEAGIPIPASTLYDWRWKGKHPEVFISLDGALFVDKAALGQLFESNRLTEKKDTRRRGASK